MCACSFLRDSHPTSQIYLNISTFYHRHAVPVSCSCACVRVHSVAVQWWYAVLCFCVSVFCVFSRPCALGLTIQRYARRQRAAVCPCLCAYVLAQAVYVYIFRRAPGGVLHISILFAPACRNCQPCAAYRASSSGRSVCILLAFISCFPGRAPGGALCESSIRRQQEEMRRDFKGGGDAVKRLERDIAFVNGGVHCLAVHT